MAQFDTFSLLILPALVLLIPAGNGIPVKLTMFTVKPKASNDNHLNPTELPFGKRLPTSSEERKDDLKDRSFQEKPLEDQLGLVMLKQPRGVMMGRSLSGQAVNTLNADADVPGDFNDAETDTEEPPDTNPCLEATLTERRICLQKKQFALMTSDALQDGPNTINMISANDSIYAHVHWYFDYKEDTEIWDGPKMIPYKYEFFGSCLPKTTYPDISFGQLRTSDEVVDLYTVLMKDYCHSDIVKVYKRLTNLGYLQVAPIGNMKYLSIVSNNTLLTMKRLSIDDLSSLVRLFKISAYSEIFTSMLLYPGQAIDPMARVLSYRAFMLINTALHMLDLARYHCEHHFTELVRLMYRRMLIMGREIYCRYTLPLDDIAQKQRRKNDAVATTILMEYLSSCAQAPEECLKKDAHEGYMDLFMDEQLGLYEKYKVKVGELTKRPTFAHSCTLIFPYLD